jgi:hypothetical protein
MKREVKMWLLGGVLVFSALISMPSAQAEEDDGRPYSEIAKLVGPKSRSRDPKTAMNFDYWTPIRIREYLDQAERGAGSAFQAPAECADFHAPNTRDGVVDIHYALGYFDDSTGHPIVYQNLDWGLSPSYDEGVWFGIREVLTGACPNSQRRLCGFREISSEAERRRDGETILTREMEIHGRRVEVRFRLTYASASPFYERNQSVLQSKQARFTRNSEENFFGGLHRADYDIYMGHSRNGGGPDFNPPRLNAALKADYRGYYRRETPGISRVLRELRTGDNRDVTLGLFSCDSDLHFRKKLLAVNPSQRLLLTVGSVGKLTYYDTLNLSLSYLEGALRGSCGAQLDDFARATVRDKSLFRSYNMGGRASN